MIFNSRNKKRIIIFTVIPLLAIIPIISEDMIIKIISASILVIYVAFIIFLRDSVRIKDMLDSEDDFEPEYENDLLTPSRDFDTDSGEEVKIISKKSTSDIITSQNYKPSIHTGLRQDISSD